MLEQELRQMATRIEENTSRFYSLKDIANLLNRAADEIARLQKMLKAITLEEDIQ
jgi:hypothetical protein